MGFGILFLGYFLVLNFVSPAYTDAIAAVLMLYGLYKLSGINKNFTAAAWASLAMLVFSVVELAFSICDIFNLISADTVIYSVISAVRYAVIGITSILMLLGMRDVASEVKLSHLAVKCERASYLTYPLYAMGIVLELLGIFAALPAQVMATLAVILVVCTTALTVMVLINIYSCYMKICMPGEKDVEEEKESRFEFVNAFRKHQQEKQREYAEYKLEKMKKANQKKKGKKK